MAYTKLPTDYISSYNSDDTTISFPLASLEVTTGDVRHTLSTTDADEVNGDIAEILLALLNKIYTVYAANTAPTKWSMSRSISTSGSTGSVSFGVSFNISTTPAAVTVDSES